MTRCFPGRGSSISSLFPAPYRNEVLGSTQDLLSLTRDDLYNHYRNYYQPGNALLCLAGSFEIDPTLALIKSYFEPIENHEPVRSIPTPEDEITAAQKVELQGPDEADYIQIAWRSPKASDPDFFAYTLTESILTGPSSLSMFGSGGIGKPKQPVLSRACRKPTGGVSYGSLTASIDPGTFNLNLTCRGGPTPDEVIRKIDQVVEEFLEHGPTVGRDVQMAL